MVFPINLSSSINASSHSRFFKKRQVKYTSFICVCLLASEYWCSPTWVWWMKDGWMDMCVCVCVRVCVCVYILPTYRFENMLFGPWAILQKNLLQQTQELDVSNLYNGLFTLPFHPRKTEKKPLIKLM